MGKRAVLEWMMDLLGAMALDTGALIALHGWVFHGIASADMTMLRRASYES